MMIRKRPNVNARNMLSIMGRRHSIRRTPPTTLDPSMTCGEKAPVGFWPMAWMFGRSN